jgi:hypothetical protein
VIEAIAAPAIVPAVLKNDPMTMDRIDAPAPAARVSGESLFFSSSAITG